MLKTKSAATLSNWSETCIRERLQENFIPENHYWENEKSIFSRNRHRNIRKLFKRIKDFFAVPGKTTKFASSKHWSYHSASARMAESVDALVSNTNVRKDVPVRPRLRVHFKSQIFDFQGFAIFLLVFAPRLQHRIWDHLQKYVFRYKILNL